MTKKLLRTKPLIGKALVLFLLGGLMLPAFTWNGAQALAKMDSKFHVQRTVTGIVKDAIGEPLIGVSILEKGTSNGASTDLEGNFTLNLTSSNPTLVLTYINVKFNKRLFHRQKDIHLVD